VHAPYEAPQQYLDNMTQFVENKTDVDNVRLLYQAMVKMLDDLIGTLTAAFKSKGMWDNTLVLFMSDNGGPIYDAASNYPLRGGKYSEFEGGVRVAAFASGGLIPSALRGTTHGGLGSIADVYTTLCALAGVDPRDTFGEDAGLPAVDGLDLSKMILSAQPSPRDEVPLSPLPIKTVEAWDKYDAFVNGSTTKRPKCWKVDLCDILDKDIKVKKGVTMADCCDLCITNKDGCAGAVFVPTTQLPPSTDTSGALHDHERQRSAAEDRDWPIAASVTARGAGRLQSDPNGQKPGTCRLKKTLKKQIVSLDNSGSTCFLPGSDPMPAPITGKQAGIVVGDLKLVTGTQVKMAVYSGPYFPNASTPWIEDQSIEVPDFMCSTPYKIGCLFNVSGDPTEQNDLAMSQPKDAKRLLDRLNAWSRTRFDPMRGDKDPRACTQVDANDGFYGPWLT